MRSILFLLLVAACGNVTATPDALPPDGAPDATPDAPSPVVTLALEHAAITAPRAIGVELDVTVTRAWFDGEVAVTVAGVLPAGIAAPTLTLAAGVTTGTFVLDIDAAAALATSELVIEARGVGTTAVATAPVMLTLSDAAPGFDLSFAAGALVRERALWMVPGWSSTPDTYLTTRAGYAGMVTTSWTGTPAGVIGVPVPTLVDDVNELVKPVLMTDVTAAAPQTASVALIASDGTLRQRLAVALTVGKAPALDATIGTAGRLEVGGISKAMPVAADLDASGRLVAVVATFSTAHYVRFTTAGAVDTSWAPHGVPDVFDASLRATDGLVAANGAVITLDLGGKLARLTPDGEPDTTFGASGVVASVGILTKAHALRLRGGKFIVAGGGPNNAAIMRLDSTGALDPTFNGTGWTGLPAASTMMEFIFDSQGRIVAAGFDATNRGVIARFTADGTLDTTFNSIGYVLGPVDVPFASIDEAVNGDLVVAGNHVVNERSLQGQLLRYSAAGALVPTFATGGVRTVGLSGDSFELVSLDKVRVTATSITVYGTRTELGASLAHVLIARFDDGGAPVPTFGTSGYEWLLTGTASEHFGSIRATATGIWVLANVTSAAGAFVTMRIQDGI